MLTEQKFWTVPLERNFLARYTTVRCRDVNAEEQVSDSRPLIIMPRGYWTAS